MPSKREGLLCFVHAGKLGCGRNSSTLTAKSRLQFGFLALQLKALITAMPSLNLVRVSCPNDLVGIQSGRCIRDMMKGARRAKNEIEVVLGERNSDEPFRREELDNNVAKRFFIMFQFSRMAMETMLYVLEGHRDSLAYFETMSQMLEHEGMGKHGRLDIIVGDGELLFFIIQLIKKRVHHQDLPLPPPFSLGEAIVIKEDKTWMKLSMDELKSGFK